MVPSQQVAICSKAEAETVCTIDRFQKFGLRVLTSDVRGKKARRKKTSKIRKERRADFENFLQG